MALCTGVENHIQKRFRVALNLENDVPPFFDKKLKWPPDMDILSNISLTLLYLNSQLLKIFFQKFSFQTKLLICISSIKLIKDINLTAPNFHRCGRELDSIVLSLVYILFK